MKFTVSPLCCQLLLFLVTAPYGWPQDFTVSGTVQDSAGAPLPSALVTLRSGSFEVSSRADSQGRFSFFGVPGASGTLEASAPGFVITRVAWSTQAGEIKPLQITLRPEGSAETMLVSATRIPILLSEAPGSALFFSETDLAASPALTIDDALRQVPGFSLFRRSSSRTANPTTLSLSLRGLGANGASRALVLDNGVPLLDPFGSWVYWDRIPRAALQSVEVFRGGASNLYGSDAMGGVVQFIHREPAAPAVSLEASFGNERTPDFSGWAGTKVGAWTLDASSDLFYTGGYILVPHPQRGVVDTPANSEHGTLDLGIGHQLGSRGLVFARTNLFEESRHNGSALQNNDTSILEPVLGINSSLGTNSSITARVFGDVQNYHQSFSAISADRRQEFLTDLQHVPAQEFGADVQWTHAVGHRHTLLAGLDVLETMGTSEEQLFASGTHTANALSGGRQRTVGLFGEDILRLGQWTLIPALRFDHWINFQGRSLRTPLVSSQSPSAVFFPDKSYDAFSPRLSLVRALGRSASFTISGYRAFRAPTLNELYRSFRLGNILTQNNAALRAERLTGGEAGVFDSFWDRRINLRTTFFWSDIVNPVANVTISQSPTLIIRQRQNLGRTRSRGLEADGTLRVSEDVQFSAGYAYTDAKVVRFPPDPTLEGLDVPQVPHHQFTAEARYWNPTRLLLSIQGRYVSKQFDDDKNQFPLGSFFIMDMMLGRSVWRGVQGFIAAENILDRSYAVGRTPVTTLGPPALFRIGLRYDYGR
jgi:outer membrane receptor protein involved in Fe transport